MWYLIYTPHKHTHTHTNVWLHASCRKQGLGRNKTEGFGRPWWSIKNIWLPPEKVIQHWDMQHWCLLPAFSWKDEAQKCSRRKRQSCLRIISSIWFSFALFILLICTFYMQREIEIFINVMKDKSYKTTYFAKTYLCLWLS